MRIRVLSDLHNEFLSAPRKIARVPQVDVVVLPGDIDVGTRGLAWVRDAFDSRIIYVPGNHEYYGHDFDETRQRMAETAVRLGIDLLDPGVVEIDGVVFVGATLWTDFALFRDAVREMELAQQQMNDHRLIRGLSAEQAWERHNEERALIERVLEETRGKTRIVVTHHLPSWRSVAERYRGDRLSAAFASDLDELIVREKPVLWVHGHTHNSVDYQLGATRVVSNPGGYPGREENAEFDERLVVEV